MNRHIGLGPYIVFKWRIASIMVNFFSVCPWIIVFVAECGLKHAHSRKNIFFVLAFFFVFLGMQFYCSCVARFHRVYMTF